MDLIEKHREISKKTILERDEFGFENLFYRFENSQLKFSDKIESLSSTATGEFDIFAIAQSLMFDLSDFTRTFYPSIRSLAPGEKVIFDRNNSIQSHRKIPTPAVPFVGTLAEAAVHWRAFLERSIETKLKGLKKIAVFVSGGLDSCSLLSIIAFLKDSGRLDCEVEVYHVKFDSEYGSDSGIVRDLSAQLKFEYFEFRPEQNLKLINFNSDPLWKDLPFAPNFQFYEPLLATAKKNNCEVAVFGYGADEQLTPPSTSWKKSIVAAGRALAPSAVDFILSKKPPKLSPPLANAEIFNDVKRKMLSNWNLIPEQVSGSFKRELWLRNLSSGISQFHLSVHKMLCRKHGLNCSFPYADESLITFSLSLPNSFLAAEKWLLREAVGDVLQDKVRLKSKFQDYSNYVLEWFEAHRKDFDVPFRLAELGLISLEQWKMQLESSADRVNTDILFQIQSIENWIRFQEEKS